MSKGKKPKYKNNL